MKNWKKKFITQMLMGLLLVWIPLSLLIMELTGVISPLIMLLPMIIFMIGLMFVIE